MTSLALRLGSNDRARGARLSFASSSEGGESVEKPETTRRTRSRLVAVAGERRINGTFHLTPRDQVLEIWWRLLPDAVP
jgi:hypothetical protein